MTWCNEMLGLKSAFLQELHFFYQELMKQDTQNGMKRVRVNVDKMGVFVITNNVRMMINAGMNAKN